MFQVHICQDGLASTKQLLKDIMQLTPVRLEPATPRSPVKHSTTKPLHSIMNYSEDPLQHTLL